MIRPNGCAVYRLLLARYRPRPNLTGSYERRRPHDLNFEFGVGTVSHDSGHAYGLVCYSNRSPRWDSIPSRIITPNSEVNDKTDRAALRTSWPASPSLPGVWHAPHKSALTSNHEDAWAGATVAHAPDLFTKACLKIPNRFFNSLFLELTR